MEFLNFKNGTRSFLMTLILLSSVAFTMAQGDGTKGTTKISGHVKDSLTNKAVEYANIALIDLVTKKPINGSVADDKGKFIISNVAAGTYNIEISFIGFETKRIDNLKVTDKNIDIGSFIISPSVETLKEVVVQGQRQLIEEKVDRTVYNAENDATTRGGDATDVLKRVPMLSVDLDGNVSMRGSQNIRVLINNKPSTIAASSVADALKQIPADQIKSVEVITSPSAKYDAEGSAGIINIITKKNNLQGATLNVDAGAGLRGSNLGVNGNYRKGKMGFSLGGFGRAGYNINGSFKNNQATYNYDSMAEARGVLLSNSTQQADTRSTNLMGRYQLGWDYDINKFNSLTASARYGVRNGSNYQDGLLSQSTYSSNALPPISTLTDVKTIDNSGTIDLSLDYNHTFEKPQKEFSISTLYSRNNRNNDFQNTNFDSNDNSIINGRLKNENQSFNQEITLQADYQTPISTNQLVEIGAKNIMRSVSSDYKSFTALGSDGDFTESTNVKASNVFNYNQNVTAGYFSYTVSLPKAYSLKAGTRYEYTVIDANFQNPTETETKIPSYGVVVPSVNLSKKLKNGNTLKAAYNRRIQRPSIQFLNPNIQAGNRLNVTIGNPNLNPEYTNNYELSYSTFVKGTSLNFSTFMRNTTGSIQSIREVIKGTNVIQTTYDNIGQEDAYGASIFSNVAVGTKLSLNGGTDFYYAVLNNNLSNKQYTAGNQGWVASGRLFGSYNMAKGWGFQFFGFYRGRQVQLQGTQGGFGVYSLGLKKDFTNKKGSVGFGLENFLNPTIKIKSNVESVTISQSSITARQNFSFRINFSYRFGKMSFDAPRKRKKSVSNDDLKDGGGGDGGQDSGQPAQRSGGGATTQRPVSTTKPIATEVSKVDLTANVNAVGTWAYTIESPRGGAGNLKIQKEGEVYSGSIVNTTMNRENQLKTATVKGNELSFSYEANFGGNVAEIVVKGIITGNQFTGTMQMGQFGSFPFLAKRTE